MRIFLAGATGVVGKQLIPLLREVGHVVIGTTRSPEKAAHLSAQGVQPEILDALDRQATVSAVMRARFTRPARAELLAQTAYYESVRKGLGARFRAEVEAAAQRSAAFPLHGKPSAAGTRKRLVTDFPFSLFYTQAEFGILIHAVAGDHRFPEYWLSRVPRDA